MSNGPEGAVHSYQCRVRRRHNMDALRTIMVEGKDLEEVIFKLHRDDYVLVSAKVLPLQGEKSKRSFAERLGWTTLKKPTPERAQTVSSKEAQKKIPFHWFARVNAQNLISFALQLAALLEAGIPLLKSLETTHRGTQNPYFRAVLERLILEVNQGLSLSYSLSRYPKVFSPMWVDLVKVGETTGNLPGVLHEITRYQEAAYRLKRKVISALFYPAVLVIFATGAVTFLLLKVIPEFETMFVDVGIKLPAITQVVISISQILRRHTLLVGGLVVGIIIGIAYAKRTEPGRFVFDYLRLKFPIMGALVLQASIARFARGLSTLLSSGVPILEALGISERLAGNAVVEEVLERAREAVRNGQSLGQQIESAHLFPVFMTELISTGEASGKLSSFLELIANFYEERIDAFLNRLAIVLEPILLIVLGSVIGVIVAAMLLPLTELSTSIH